jgi:uncharacterized Zn finger protein
MNPLFDTSEINAYLQGFTPKNRRRGTQHFEDGAVMQVSCLEPGRRFAAVVRGGTGEYEVNLEYRADGRKWPAQCSCNPAVDDCPRN